MKLLIASSALLIAGLLLYRHMRTVNADNAWADSEGWG